ncbi:ABC transporter substrate-binding protein [Catenovulum sp. SM1970]|uniref:ABC transporter substrate-binding protein n=1 Tax=Marinifaba aquimaris TaxID=2741323 RepID=UPI001572B208|nr:ABC transporter substrate-binding protein [Marinifaba aquimaris]NTS78792.1 ABC transporter substrate-binding protein [Marinifaba aquimaris]
MQKLHLLALLTCIAFSGLSSAAKQEVKALYIPLADHYAAIIAYEKYRHHMQYANFQLEQMADWDILRAKFLENKADMAFVMSPLALDMYSQQPSFKWLGLMHRDGNGLAINHLLGSTIKLSNSRLSRKPDRSAAIAIRQHKTKKPVYVGVPHVLSTHTVVLYHYLKQQELTLALQPNFQADVLAMTVPPPRSPAFMLGNSNRNKAVAIQQSLPWIDIVETGNFGRVAWYSKDVLTSEHGHVECIALATLIALTKKEQAVMEVMGYIKQAGAYIEQARAAGNLDEIVAIVQKHIPAHDTNTIKASLDPKLRVINYQRLDIDKDGLKRIMDIAIEGQILKKAVDIDELAYE